MRNYGPVLLLAAILCCFSAWNSRAQSHSDAQYQLINNGGMGPWLYRLNTATGDVCTVTVMNMQDAYKSLLRECASGEPWHIPSKDR